MSKISFLEKIGILFEVSQSSYFFIVIALVLIVLGCVFYTTTKKTINRNKMIYFACSIFIILLLGFTYQESISNLLDYMMNNFFIALYFPNLAIYFFAIIITNIIVWISIFNFKTSEIIKRLNIIIFIIMHYLFALILKVISEYKLDVFSQSSVYNNEKARALIELSSTIFIVWIIFLIVYKIILIYLRKDYKPKVKKVVVNKVIKKVPKNYQYLKYPKQVHGKHLVKEDKKEVIEHKDILTIEDYKLLQRVLKEQKEKEKRRKKATDILKEIEKIQELETLYKNVR